MPRPEFETLDKLKRHLDTSSDLRNAVFQALDLNAVADRLANATLRNNVLLGCAVSDALPVSYTHLTLPTILLV